jgi:hypothetical protein
MSGAWAESADKLSDLKDKASDDFAQIRQAAESQAEAAMDVAADKATEQKNFLARQLSGIAEAFEKAGSELERGDQQTVGRYARDLGSSARRIAEDIRDRDLGEVASIVEDFGRRQPVAFLGFAALAGFAASRFVTASARRRTPNQTSSYSGADMAQRRRPSTSSAATGFSNPSKEGSDNG